MDNIYITRTSESPEVDFNFTYHVLNMTGESYPENASDFFRPILVGLEAYLAATSACEIIFNFQLTYFNSSSTKMLYNLFELLNESAGTNDNRIVLNWHHDEEDDTILEFGQDIHEDFQWLDFKPIILDNAEKA
jgi:hypothetical protein